MPLSTVPVFLNGDSVEISSSTAMLAGTRLGSALLNDQSPTDFVAVLHGISERVGELIDLRLHSASGTSLSLVFLNPSISLPSPFADEDLKAVGLTC